MRGNVEDYIFNDTSQPVLAEELNRTCATRIDAEAEPNDSKGDGGSNALLANNDTAKYDAASQIAGKRPSSYQSV